jgi:hypothetical protein
MALTVETGATLAFDKFWRWLKRHPHCILRAGTADSYLFDQDDLHWYLDEDEDRVPTVQLLRGKALLAEIAIDTRDILFVQAMPDPNSSEEGQHVFEVIGGGDEPYPIYHFVLAHGFEEEGSGHRGPVLKQ